MTTQMSNYLNLKRKPVYSSLSQHASHNSQSNTTSFNQVHSSLFSHVAQQPLNSHKNSSRKIDDSSAQTYSVTGLAGNSKSVLGLEQTHDYNLRSCSQKRLSKQKSKQHIRQISVNSVIEERETVPRTTKASDKAKVTTGKTQKKQTKIQKQSDQVPQLNDAMMSSINLKNLKKFGILTQQLSTQNSFSKILSSPKGSQNQQHVNS